MGAKKQITLREFHNILLTCLENHPDCECKLFIYALLYAIVQKPDLNVAFKTTKITNHPSAAEKYPAMLIELLKQDGVLIPLAPIVRPDCIGLSTIQVSHDLSRISKEEMMRILRPSEKEFAYAEQMCDWVHAKFRTDRHKVCGNTFYVCLARSELPFESSLIHSVFQIANAQKFGFEWIVSSKWELIPQWVRIELRFEEIWV